MLVALEVADAIGLEVMEVERLNAGLVHLALEAVPGAVEGGLGDEAAVAVVQQVDGGQAAALDPAGAQTPSAPGLPA